LKTSRRVAQRPVVREVAEIRGRQRIAGAVRAAQHQLAFVRLIEPAMEHEVDDVTVVANRAEQLDFGGLSQAQDLDM
jgi:hypothetical protein